jgi:hypothetical protein
VFKNIGFVPTFALDRLATGVLEERLSHVITGFLPFPNEAAGRFPAHYFRTFVFEDGHHRFRIGGFAISLPIGDGSERPAIQDKSGCFSKAIRFGRRQCEVT